MRGRDAVRGFTGPSRVTSPALASRRSALALIGGVLGASLPAATRAQGAYPARQIVLWAPSSPGGSTDAVCRSVADSLSRRFRLPVVVENKPGAGGALAGINLASVAPDGYTLALVPHGIFRFALMQKTSFDPLRDLTYVSMLGVYSYGIVVPADSPHRTIGDLVAFAKANPGAVTYGHPGVGSSGHLSMEELAFKAGIRLTPVPFKGTPDALAALMGKQVSAMSGLIEFAPQVQAGRLRVLATLGAQRVKIFPEVPTLREQGIDLVSDSSFGICAPRGTPAAVVGTLQDALKAALDDPKVLAVFDRYTLPVTYLDARDYQEFARRSVAAEADLLGRLGLVHKS